MSISEITRHAASLASGPQQSVSVAGPEITIEPVSPEIVYVPAYNPLCVYGAWPAPAYPPFSFGTWPGYCTPVLEFGGGTIDETRQDREAPPVDLECIAVNRRPRRRDRSDRLPLDHQIDVTAIDMGLRSLVKGDKPGGVANGICFDGDAMPDPLEPAPPRTIAR
jgi:hypothetical protein